MKAKKEYTVSTEYVRQPLDHSRPEGESFTQRVKLLTPAAAGAKTKVLFIMGLEADFPLKKGRIMTVRGGFDGPERYPDTGVAVFAAALEYLKEGTK